MPRVCAHIHYGITSTRRASSDELRVLFIVCHCIYRGKGSCSNRVSFGLGRDCAIYESLQKRSGQDGGSNAAMQQGSKKEHAHKRQCKIRETGNEYTGEPGHYTNSTHSHSGICSATIGTGKFFNIYTPKDRQPGSQAARQPGSQAARQPGSQAARQPGSQAASQAGRQPASQPASQARRSKSRGKKKSRKADRPDLSYICIIYIYTHTISLSIYIYIYMCIYSSLPTPPIAIDHRGRSRHAGTLMPRSAPPLGSTAPAWGVSAPRRDCIYRYMFMGTVFLLLSLS